MLRLYVSNPCDVISDLQLTATADTRIGPLGACQNECDVIGQYPNLNFVQAAQWNYSACSYHFRVIEPFIRL